MLRRRSREHSVLWLSAVYLLGISVIVLVYYGDLIPLLFSLVAVSLLYKKRAYMGFLFLASSSIYMSSKDLYVLLAVTPFILVFPLNVKIVASPKIVPTGFFGPLTRSVMLISLLYLPAIFIRPMASLYHTILYAYLFILVVASYTRLRSISFRVVHVPKTAVIGSKPSIVLFVDSMADAYIHVVGGETSIVKQVPQGSTRIEVLLPAKKLGVLPFRFKVYAVDTMGFTARSIGIIEGEVNVVPYTKIAVEKIRKVLKEVLVEAGFPIEVRVYSMRGAYGGGYGEGEDVEEGPLRRVVARVLRSGWTGLIGVKRRVRGEYMGSREFSGGDSPRNIHWKKSVSMKKLYVKEYGGVGGGGGGRLIIVSDLLAANSRELDVITYTTLSLIASMLVRNTRAEVSLVVVAPSNEILYVKGTPLQILSFFTRVYEEGLVKLFYEYEGSGREYGPGGVHKLLSYKDESRFLDAARVVAILYSRRILGILSEKKLLPPALFTIIHGKPSILHNSVLKELMVMNGYTYIPPRIMPYSELTRVVATIASG